MMVDAHLHVWEQQSPSRSWQRDLPGYSLVDASPERVRQVAETAGIGAVVAVQPLNLGADHSLLERLVCEQGDFFYAVMLADPADSDPRKTIKRLAATGFRGVRLHRDLMPRRESLAEVGAAVACAAEAAGLVLDLFIGPERYEEIPFLLHRHPSLTVVIDHLGLPLVAENAVTRLAALACCRNLFVKLSPADGTTTAPWPHSDMADAAKIILDSFGSERVMWGSNFPFFAGPRFPNPVTAELQQLLPDLSGCEIDQVGGKTAMHVFKIDRVAERDDPRR